MVSRPCATGTTARKDADRRAVRIPGSRVELRRRDIQAPAPRLGAPRSPVRDLDGLLSRVPGCARGSRPQRRGRVLERGVGAAHRERTRGAVRAGGATRGRHVVDPRHADLVYVLALPVRGRRDHAALGVLPPSRAVRRLPQLAHRREPRRPRGLHPHADGTSTDVPGVGLRRHPVPVRVDQPRQRPHRARLEPVRGDAEPARDGRVDRRGRHVRGRPLAPREGPVGRVARLGRVLGDLDGEPLLARRDRRVRARGPHRIRAPARQHASPPARMSDEPPGDGRTSVNQLDRVKQEYTQAAREILARSMRGVAKTKLTPDMLTLAGVSLCLAGAVLVGFEDRNEKLFFWLGGVLFVVGSIADILDGALARAASKGTVFGAFLDSTFDRLGEAAMLAAIGLVFMRDGNELALIATFAAVIGSFLVSYTRAKAESLGLRGDVGFGSRVERVVLISVGLGLAPWGLLEWPIYALALIVWLAVVQRMLFVRRQLRELAEA